MHVRAVWAEIAQQRRRAGPAVSAHAANHGTAPTSDELERAMQHLKGGYGQDGTPRPALGSAVDQCARAAFVGQPLAADPLAAACASTAAAAEARRMTVASVQEFKREHPPQRGIISALEQWRRTLRPGLMKRILSVIVPLEVQHNRRRHPDQARRPPGVPASGSDQHSPLNPPQRASSKPSPGAKAALQGERLWTGNTGSAAVRRAARQRASSRPRARSRQKRTQGWTRPTPACANCAGQGGCGSSVTTEGHSGFRLTGRFPRGQSRLSRRRGHNGSLALPAPPRPALTPGARARHVNTGAGAAPSATAAP